MPHPLDGPREKVKRANQHVNELKGVLEAFGKLDPYGFYEEVEADGRRVFKAIVRYAVPVEVRLITGDIIHNLRSALDHLAHVLVEANGGTPHRSTAFPISATAKKFEASLSNVKAARQDAPDLIKATRAYKGGNDGLWALRELDDGDKHRLLIAIAASHASVGIHLGPHRLTGEAAEVFKDAPSIVIPIKPANPQYPLKTGDEVFAINPDVPRVENEPDPEIAIQVALGEPDVFEGEPLFPTMVQLRDLVSGVVESFAPLLDA